MISILLGLLSLISVHSTVLIISPKKTPFSNNYLPYLYANFGVVNYGKSQDFNVVVLNSTLCSVENMSKFKTPTYIVAEGNYTECSYPDQAINAQSLGAKGIIYGSEETKYYDDIVWADDGKGQKVHITCLFITLQDMQTLSKLQSLRIKVNFPIVKKEKSQVTFFLSAVGRQNYIFLRNFKSYFDKVKNSIDLNLVYDTFECTFCGDDDCVFDGKFCQLDTENWHYGMGSNILQEQFRQFNLFKFVKENSQIDTWFDYMNQFDENCDYNWINARQCSNTLLNKLKISKNLDEGDEFGTMSAWRQKETKAGMYIVPGVTVNGIKHMENLTPSSVFQMICTSLQYPPDDCTNSTTSSSSKTGLIIGMVILAIVFFLGGIYCYKACVRRQLTNSMATRANELVSQYMTKISENSKKKREKMMEKMTEQL